MESYRAQKRALRAAQPRTPWYLQRLAAGFAIALVSGATGWGLHGGVPNPASSTALAPGSAQRGPASITMASATGFAQRAAVAHAVYSPEQRRPVEVDAAHGDQSVWLRDLGRC